VRLSRTESIGPISFYALLRRFGSARAALEALPRLARRGERARTVTATTRAAAEAELTALHRIGGLIVCWGEPGYPNALAQVEDAPPILSVLGQREWLDRPMVAIVGARNASANGRRLARDSPPVSAGAGSSSSRGWRAASTLRRIWERSKPAPPQSSPAASTLSIPKKTAASTTRCAGTERSSPSCRSAASRRRGISRAATGSFPAWRWACWWSRRRPARAR
jgi:DNA recombination-mediator protein A